MVVLAAITVVLVAASASLALALFALIAVLPQTRAHVRRAHPPGRARWTR